MTVAILVGMHGCAAEQLIKTAEMILGNQDNIEFVEFIVGENTEILVEKYKDKIKKMCTSKGMLFLIDTWGGSPFNAASRLVFEKENHDIIVGVNIPILIEILMKREENISFNELVSIAVKTGRESIKSFQNQTQNIQNTTSSHTMHNITQKKLNKNMQISLVRIDDRLIHGQITTRWTKETKVQRIIVVNDEISQDDIRTTLLKQSSPPGITAHVINVDKMIRVWNNPKYSQDRVMLLFTNPIDVLRVVEKGVNIKAVNIGGMAFKEGKLQVSKAVSLDEKDITAFNKLNELNIELEVRKVSNDPKVNIMDLIHNTNNIELKC
ncbi:PTS mannose transporter subunit IIAB [Candidatus Pantoea edessiphila]|uniref:PTS system mannose-specific EIIAB component n=1 Tax=Candidatus Pantoea edessiphila TaxID=2044610 RepID=A0A2P5SYM3_9GAMM|nr:PTS mannose transporter subunit IIAB [Candidatus Pantoea edessiphila]MBK4775431.1 PTS mannose transporter subunit IIAB [Pantoea sp. Edef]PPI87439.1 PTS mannose transporter subunit IIAB [Candidatus Pantoea edessiphila]